jgi:hypothetical protein
MLSHPAVVAADVDHQVTEVDDGPNGIEPPQTPWETSASRSAVISEMRGGDIHSVQFLDDVLNGTGRQAPQDFSHF